MKYITITDIGEIRSSKVVLRLFDMIIGQIKQDTIIFDDERMMHQVITGELIKQILRTDSDHVQ